MYTPSQREYDVGYGVRQYDCTVQQKALKGLITPQLIKLK